MTRNDDIDRVLDRWLSEGPTQMPSRFLDDTLDRIDRAPQHRLARLRTRLPLMNPMLRLATAAAVVLAVAGLGAAALMQTGGVGSRPSAGTGVLPASLQAEWHPVGTRQHPTRLGGTEQYDLDIVIDPTTIAIFEWPGDVRNSALLVGANRLDVRMLDNPVVQSPEAGATEPRTVWHCHVGDSGTYTFRLSSGDQHLTLTAVNDPCAERATILAGDWTRTELGDLATGPHLSRVFRPFSSGTSGQFSFTVPSGWAATDVRNFTMSLRNAGVSGEASIRLLSSVIPQEVSPDGGCVGGPVDVKKQRTPAAIAAWLATRMVVTAPTPVTIGGLSGVMVDVSDNASLLTCPNLFIYFDDPLGAAQSDQRRARYFLLDRGDGQILLIAIEAPNNATRDRVISDAMPIVETFEFIR